MQVPLCYNLCICPSDPRAYVKTCLFSVCSLPKEHEGAHHSENALRVQYTIDNMPGAIYALKETAWPADYPCLQHVFAGQDINHILSLSMDALRNLIS